MRCGTYTHDFSNCVDFIVYYISIQLYTSSFKTLRRYFANITQFHVIDLVCKYKQLSLQDDYHIFIKSEISLFSRFWQLIYAMRPSSINSREKYLWRCLCVITMNMKIIAKCMKKRNVLLWKYTSWHIIILIFTKLGIHTFSCHKYSWWGLLW